jgi:tripartite-type tricarboxylate transporter receptor subunit TctC
MKLPRRQFLHLATGAATLPSASRFAWAQNYPTRPVRLVVGFFAGGLTDILARVLGEWLSERLGQQFIVEDQAGAGTNLATERVVRASPDGYTLLMATSSNAINATLYDHLNFDFLRDTAPVASIARTPLVMAVNPSFPANPYAKAHPGEINMASVGKGSTVQLAGELFMTMTGVKLTVVHYRESYVPDMLAGRVQVVFSPIPTTIQQIRADKLRAVAVTSDTRSPALPDVPTVAEFVPSYEAIVWNGVVTPKNTPVEIIDRLNSEITASLVDPKVKAQFANVGSVPKSMTPAEFGKFVAVIRRQCPRHAPIVRLPSLANQRDQGRLAAANRRFIGSGRARHGARRLVRSLGFETPGRSTRDDAIPNVQPRVSHPEG